MENNENVVINFALEDTDWYIGYVNYQLNPRVEGLKNKDPLKRRLSYLTKKRINEAATNNNNPLSPNNIYSNTNSKTIEFNKNHRPLFDLRHVYKRIAGKMGVKKNIPVTNGNLKIETIQVCASSAGCTSKHKANKIQNNNNNNVRIPASRDYLVKYQNVFRNGSPTVNRHNNLRKHVMLFMTGTLTIWDTRPNTKRKIDPKKDPGIECKVHIRVPRSGRIGVRIGLQNQNNIKPEKNENRYNTANINSDTKLKKLGQILEYRIFGLMGHAPGGRPPTNNIGVPATTPRSARRPKHPSANVLKNSLIPFKYIHGKEGEPKIENIIIHGYNLITEKNKRLGKIRNFKRVMRKMETFFPRNLDYELTLQEGSGKKIKKAWFKTRKPDANNNSEENIESRPTIGITEWGMVDFTKADTVISIIECKKYLKDAFKKTDDELFVRRNIITNTVPKSLKQNAKTGYTQNNNNMNQNANLPRRRTPSTVPIYNVNSNSIMYRNRPFNCMSLKKADLQEITKKMGLNPLKLKKQDLCAQIIRHVKKERRTPTLIKKGYNIRLPNEYISAEEQSRLRAQYRRAQRSQRRREAAERGEVVGILGGRGRGRRGRR